VGGRQHDAFERRGVGRAGTGLELGVEQALVDVVPDPEQRVPVLTREETPDAEVIAVVDGRLGPERTALLEILLDLGGAVVDLDRGRDAAGDHARVEAPGRLATHAPAEHHGDVVGAPERELVTDRLLKPRAPRRRAVKHARVRELQLPKAQLVAVAAAAILRR
jgi:hypothetical protein